MTRDPQSTKADLAESPTSDWVDLLRLELPKGMALEIQGDMLRLSRRWYSHTGLVMLMFTLIWNISILTMAVSDGGLVYFALPHTWIGIGLFYSALTRVFNSTQILVNPSRLQVIHGPIPMWGNKTFNPADLHQFYVREVKHHNKGSAYYTYDLYAGINHGRKLKLVEEIADPDHALHLELVLEEFLRLEDRPVSGEFRLRDLIRNQMRAGEGWPLLAAVNGLTTSRGSQLGAFAIHGRYKGCYLKLHTFYKGRRNSLSVTTRLEIAPSSAELSAPKPQPDLTPKTLESLFHLYRKGQPVRVKRPVTVEHLPRRFIYHYPAFEDDIDYLQALFDCLCNLMMAYPRVADLGGEAVPVLLQPAENKEHPLQAIAVSLLETVGQGTAHLQPQLPTLLCQHCLTRCTRHEVKVARGERLTYYGCRACGQSRHFWEAPVVIAVLDASSKTKLTPAQEPLCINWLADKTLFDFDAVEIIQATDKDVEQFVVQLGNDTDPKRTAARQTMTCHLAPEAQLSENTRRLLKRTFSEVHQLPHARHP